MKVPREVYVETFIDAGDNDMLACLRALHADRAIRVCCIPTTCRRCPATSARRAGFGYAVGQMKAMLRQL